jgi:glycosyltransferase involved in cell wall biosynthesis
VNLTRGASNGSTPAATLVQKSLNAVRVSVGSAIQWRSLLAKHRIELVHLNNSVFSTMEWVIAARLAGSKCVCHQRGYTSRGIAAARHFDRIVCISNQIRDHLVSVNPALRRNTVAIHDALDTEAFLSRRSRTSDQVRREWGIPESAVLIGMVGNIKEWKGQRVLVEAFASLHRRFPDVRCLLIGATSRISRDRAYSDSVLKRVEELGLQDRILVTGFREDVPDLVSALDILVHASIEPEPMGRVILEGMALGKPVIATDHGGPREIIEPGTSGFLVPPNDPGRLSACLIDLVESPALRQRIAEGGRRRVQDAFGIRQHMDSIHQVYESLWAGSKA